VATVIRRMSLLWGVHPVQCTKLHNTDQMVDTAERLLSAAGYVREGQILGIVAGTRTKTGSTNFLRLHTVGDTNLGSHKVSQSAKTKKKKPNQPRQSGKSEMAATQPKVARKTRP
jgi:pyruvate kinase